ncbi:hypothetical protein N1031_17500 [Herbiconiux moechotypicola]|uniref:Uncharacterized protein n=1 Tax=Herbiconiux moechotypicola TaxID=637393 RepID=A0ABN3E3B4_9MICO|nr:hypothetical protein [Herbiconiux moechotypicola]MCS5731559.1 hypothetical protein [Herbiconiux moechotypicola]
MRSPVDNDTLGRRSVLAAGVWSVPVVVAAVAAPAAAASDSPGLVDLLTLTVGVITESADTGLDWSGATLTYLWSADGPETIGYTWTATLLYDDGNGVPVETAIGTGSDTVAKTGSVDFGATADGDDIVDPPVPPGTYTVEVVIVASDGSTRTWYGNPYIVAEPT